MMGRNTRGIKFFEYPSTLSAKLRLVGLPNLDYNIINSSERFLQRSTFRLYSSNHYFKPQKMGRIIAYAVRAFVMDYSIISSRQKFPLRCRANNAY